MSFELHTGDCLAVMRTLPDNCVDSIVTDPPYGIGFMGKAWDHGVPGVDFWAEMLRVIKPGGHLLAFGGSRTYHRMACAIEDASWEIRDSIMWIYGSGFPKSHNGPWGGTGLKPAHEPIVMARKPLIGTVAANVLEHGTGALNIDACRVPTNDVLSAGAGGIPCRHDENIPRGRSDNASHDRRYTEAGGTNFAMKPGPRGGDAAGRWPANVIHDGSDVVLSAFPAAPGQRSAITGNEPTASGFSGVVKFGGMIGRVASSEPRMDSGSAARFFYCAKASRKDRNDGLEGMSERPLHWSSGSRSPGTFQSDGTHKAAQNNHPTVKPTELMRYLCRLITPAGGLVLDPFMGSGSTGRGALLEGLRFVGIEQDADYTAIAQHRIQAIALRKVA